MLHPKVVSAVVVAVFLPILLVVYSIHQRHQKLLEAKDRLSALALKAKKTSLLRSRAIFFSKQAELSDGDFLKKNISNITLLKKEQEELHELLKNKEIKESLLLKKREKELSENQLVFEEEKKQEKDKIEERLLVLKKEIELSEQDLSILLNKIENPSLVYSNTRPQLFFKKFSLKKKQLSPSYEVFECDFSLIERKKKKS